MIKTGLDLIEEGFHDKELLQTEYLQKYRSGYEWSRSNGFLNPYRNYSAILNYFSEIRIHNPQHERSFAKRIMAKPENWRNCESVVSEVIVYQYYIRLIRESLIKRIEIEKDEADLIVCREDGSRMFLEIFCIMPEFPVSKPDEIRVIDVRTHSHEAFASVRQKLLKKIRKQRQLSKKRENFAVIEMNHPTIANDFSVAASLSDGYKIWYDRETMTPKREGCDWEASVFDLPETEFLKAVIWLHLGAYEYRKMIMNPKFSIDRK